MKNTKINYKVRVYLVDDKTSYRLKYYHKTTGKYLKEFEQRFKADSREEAMMKRDAEQSNPKWLTYSGEITEIKGDFISYFKNIGQSQLNMNTKRIYHFSLQLFKSFRGNSSLTFNEITKEIIIDFRDFLLARTKQNSASVYFAVFFHALNRAADEGFLQKISVKRIPGKAVKKDVLTEHEINTIIKTEWNNRYKEIFLFECLTSVSYDDLKRLKWKQIEMKTINFQGGKKPVFKLSFIRGKTRNEVNMILSDEIIRMLGERKGDEDYIFTELTSQSNYNRNIKGLIRKAGINKHITSHCARATAIIRVTESEGIYAAAKQAGHSKIETTLRYAQYTDKMMYGAQNALMNGINLP